MQSKACPPGRQRWHPVIISAIWVPSVWPTAVGKMDNCAWLNLVLSDITHHRGKQPHTSFFKEGGRFTQMIQNQGMKMTTDIQTQHWKQKSLRVCWLKRQKIPEWNQEMWLPWWVARSHLRPTRKSRGGNRARPCNVCLLSSVGLPNYHAAFLWKPNKPHASSRLFHSIRGAGGRVLWIADTVQAHGSLQAIIIQKKKEIEMYSAKDGFF